MRASLREPPSDIWGRPAVSSGRSLAISAIKAIRSALFSIMIGNIEFHQMPSVSPPCKLSNGSLRSQCALSWAYRTNTIKAKEFHRSTMARCWDCCCFHSMVTLASYREIPKNLRSLQRGTSKENSQRRTFKEEHPKNLQRENHSENILKFWRIHCSIHSYNSVDCIVSWPLAASRLSRPPECTMEEPTNRNHQKAPCR